MLRKSQNLNNFGSHKKVKGSEFELQEALLTMSFCKFFQQFKLQLPYLIIRKLTRVAFPSETQN